MTDARRFVADRAPGLAASAVILGLAVLAVEFRMGDVWSDGAQLALLGGAAAAFFGLGLLGPRIADRPAAETSVLLVVGLVIAFLALLQLAVVLDADEFTSGTFTWIFAAWGVLCLIAAGRCGSAVAALLAAGAATGLVLVGVDWLFDPTSLSTFRYLLTGLAVVFFLAGLSAGGSRPRHGVVLVGAAGLAAIGLGFLLTVELVASLFGGLVSPFLADGDNVASAYSQSWGWQLVELIFGLALVAYATSTREPGPGYLGAIVLIEFLIAAVLRIEDEPSIKGWPLALLIGGAVILVYTLRPRVRR
jgi:hypothetical protein